MGVSVSCTVGTDSGSGPKHDVEKTDTAIVKQATSPDKPKVRNVDLPEQHEEQGDMVAAFEYLVDWGVSVPAQVWNVTRGGSSILAVMNRNRWQTGHIRRFRS